MLANAARQDVGVGHAAIQDIFVGFGLDRQRLNVVCTEAPGVVVFTDPAMDDEAEIDSVPWMGIRVYPHTEKNRQMYQNTETDVSRHHFF